MTENIVDPPIISSWVWTVWEVLPEFQFTSVPEVAAVLSRVTTLSIPVKLAAAIRRLTEAAPKVPVIVEPEGSAIVAIDRAIKKPAVVVPIEVTSVV